MAWINQAKLQAGVITAGRKDLTNHNYFVSFPTTDLLVVPDVTSMRDSDDVKRLTQCSPFEPN